MRALSLTQPWATLLVCGQKRIETRAFRPQVVGQGDVIAIHAASRMKSSDRQLCMIDPFKKSLSQCYCHTDQGTRICPKNLCEAPWHEHYLSHDEPIWKPEWLSRGALVGLVKLERFLPTVQDGRLIKATEKEYIFGDFSPNRWAWFVSHPVMFSEPIEYKGALSLFEVDDDVILTEGISLYG